MGDANSSAWRRRRGKRKPWDGWSDEELLELRICDLNLAIEGTPVERQVRRLYDELGRKGIRFRPHVWLSSEWFSPDGVPGIAAPFYLAHPRLMRLEARQMLEVDGGTTHSCMRLLRHEAGHAIDTAFRLHFKAGWRKNFGKFSKPYPRHYRPRPNSRRFVQHLDGWYAQAHPAEDWAETFAVWLTPRSQWRQTYAEWPRALAKLEYVDELISESVHGKPARVRSRARPEPVSRLTMTLGQHYEEKRTRLGAAWPDDYDPDLARLFSRAPKYASRPSAARFLRSLRTELRTQVARWTGAPPYTIDQVMQEMIERCREQKLRLAVSHRQARIQAIILVTVHTMNCLRGRRHEIPM